MKSFYTFVVMALFLFLGGCAELDLPTPEEVIKHPLGTESIKIGMSKNKVKDLWGEPDEIRHEEIKELEGKRYREVWIYKGRYAAIPVDAGYLSKSKYLYFDGNSLTKITESELKSE